MEDDYGIQHNGDRGVEPEELARKLRAMPKLAEVSASNAVKIIGLPYGGQDDGTIISRQPVSQSRQELPA